MVYHKFSASFGTTIGDLWEIYGLSVALLYERVGKYKGTESLKSTFANTHTIGGSA
jgi:hypothetical protein